ncbi:hypothetical protein [Streptomyces sp. NPDC055243]|uniref:hypothetical protein n=1 Tax=Streptomyces sp. NPDC055243 TaxID=3365720 RepID=UPI0037D95404
MGEKRELAAAMAELDVIQGELARRVNAAGNLFTWERVDSVSKLSCSEKVVGEGIGNKGVGFRSVLQISAEPEIYSARPDGGTPAELDGYCFRFATPDDLSLLLGDAELVSRATDEFPPFQLPFPVSVVPESCATLALAGHVTVIRPPLRSEIARGEVRRRIDELAGSGAPAMLFLDRLARLMLECRTGDVLERTERIPIVLDHLVQCFFAWRRHDTLPEPAQADTLPEPAQACEAARESWMLRPDEQGRP